MKKIVLSMVIILLFSTMVFANGGGESGKKKRIFLITMDSLDEHWLSVQEGAEAEIKKLGMEKSVELVFLAPPQKADPSEQIRIVEDAIIQEADGIILAPTDKVALVPVVKKIKENNIPLMLVDSGVDLDDSHYLTFAATDNYNAAVMAAKRLASLLGERGKVAIINAQPGSATTILRSNGFVDTVESDYPNMEVVAIQYSNGDKLLALDQATDIIQANPDLKGFYTSNEGSTVGVSRAIETKKLQGKIKLVGFDKSTDIISGIENGVIDAAVVQNPEKMGAIAVSIIFDYWNTQKAPSEKKVDTGITLVDKSNLNLIKK